MSRLPGPELRGCSLEKRANRNSHSAGVQLTQPETQLEMKMDAKQLAKELLSGCMERRNCATGDATAVAEGMQLHRVKLRKFLASLELESQREFGSLKSFYLRDGLSENDAGLLAMRRMGGEVDNSWFEWQL